MASRFRKFRRYFRAIGMEALASMTFQPRRRQKLRLTNKTVEGLDLLGELRPTAPSVDPVHGLLVTLPDRCSCGSRVAIIGEGKERYGASLFCCRCEGHRGLLPVHVHGFLTQIAKCFERPTTPTEIRRSEQPIKNSDSDPECAPTATSGIKGER
jgi:hypothetical protein